MKKEWQMYRQNRFCATETLALYIHRIESIRGKENTRYSHIASVSDDCIRVFCNRLIIPFSAAYSLQRQQLGNVNLGEVATSYRPRFSFQLFHENSLL